MVAALTVDAPAGSSWRIQYVDTLGDLNKWIDSTTITLPTRPYVYFDTSANSSARRYCRALEALTP